MRDLEKEIEVIKSMIDLLNRCLFISLKNNRIKEVKNTVKDIQLCKRELRKLILARDEAPEAQKEPAINGEVQRS
jgi:hypothetical protein